VKPKNSAFTIHYSLLFWTPRARNARGSALVETAIVLPLYLIVLYGLIYFGYATLSKQRGTLAAAYAAWHPAEVQADRLLEEFWPWEGSPSMLLSGSGFSEALAGDTRLGVGEVRALGDDYYGTLVPCQLAGGPGSLGGGGDHTFALERIAVSLWTYALGKVEQRFEWVPGQGFVERIQWKWDDDGDDMASYLNAKSEKGAKKGGAFIEAGEGSPPSIGRYEYEKLIAYALTGVEDPWIVRPRVTLRATYRPPFFRTVYREPESPAASFGTYVAGSYPEPEYEPTATMRFDLTTRGGGVRRAVGEDGMTSEDMLAAVEEFLDYREGLSPPDEMDDCPLGDLGTLRELWSAR